MNRRVITAVAALISSIGATPAIAAVDDLGLISRLSGAAGAGLTNESGGPSVSENGRYIAFASRDDALSTEDSATTLWDIFVRDSTTGGVTLVSRATGVAGAASDGNSTNPSISADGRYVAFMSDAASLGNAVIRTRIYVRDLTTGTTTLVSRVTGALGADANGQSLSPAISADGTHVAFVSLASNLADVPVNKHEVFVRDLTNDTTVLASKRYLAGVPAAAFAATDDSDDPSISADGRYVAFTSKDDHVAFVNVGLNNRHVFRRDTIQNITELVSKVNGINGNAADNGDSFDPAISANGRYVAFTSEADDLSPVGPTPRAFVFVRDMDPTNQTTTLVSGPGSPGTLASGGSSSAPTISADGLSVGFVSTDNDLVAGDTNSTSDVFVSSGGTIRLASRQSGAAGAAADGPSAAPALSQKGSVIAFESNANNLSSVDDNSVTNIFVRELAPVPFTMIAPTLAGTPTEGETLTCVPHVTGASAAASPTFIFGWTRNGVAIAGATASNFTLSTSDAGTSIRCRVVATSGAVSLTDVSSPLVAAALPSVTPPPTPIPVTTTTTPSQTSTPAVVVPAVQTAVVSTGVPEVSFNAGQFSVQSIRAASSGGPVAVSGGSSLMLTTNASGTTTLEFIQLRTGRRAGSKCVLAGGKGGRCVRTTRLASKVTLPTVAGANIIHLTGRLNGRKLAPGTYRVVISFVSGRASISGIGRTLKITK